MARRNGPLEGEGEVQSDVFTTDTCELKLPIAPLPVQGYTPQHLDVILSAKQGSALRRLTMGMEQAGARLERGAPVRSHADAVRFLLEQVS